MENEIKYRYHVAVKHMLVTFVVLTLAIGVAVFLAEWIMLLLLVAGAIYVLFAIVRVALSEKAVYITDAHLSVPRTNLIAFPTFTSGNKNIRIPYEAVTGVTTHYSQEYGQEYLHIHYDDEDTTLTSSMFESGDLFEDFKVQLAARLAQFGVEVSSL